MNKEHKKTRTRITKNSAMHTHTNVHTTLIHTEESSKKRVTEKKSDSSRLLLIIFAKI